MVVWLRGIVRCGSGGIENKKWKSWGDPPPPPPPPPPSTKTTEFEVKIGAKLRENQKQSIYYIHILSCFNGNKTHLALETNST